METDQKAPQKPTPNNDTKGSQNSRDPMKRAMWIGMTVLAVFGGIVLLAVLAGYVFNWKSNPTADENSKETVNSTSEAYKNGEGIGLIAGQKARANGNRATTLNDTDVDQMRVLVSSNQFDSQKQDWDKGFKAGYEQGNKLSDDAAMTSDKISKAQWKQKVIAHYGDIARIGMIGPCNPTEFQKLMGMPSQTQTIDGSAIWNYDCNDGTIQLELNAAALSAGVMQGKINDF